MRGSRRRARSSPSRREGGREKKEVGGTGRGFLIRLSRNIFASCAGLSSPAACVGRPGTTVARAAWILRRSLDPHARLLARPCLSWRESERSYSSMLCLSRPLDDACVCLGGAARLCPPASSSFACAL